MLSNATNTDYSIANVQVYHSANYAAMVTNLFGAVTSQVAQVLAWLEQADGSRGSRKPVLAAGRDGVFVPIHWRNFGIK